MNGREAVSASIANLAYIEANSSAVPNNKPVNIFFSFVGHLTIACVAITSI